MAGASLPLVLALPQPPSPTPRAVSSGAVSSGATGACTYSCRYSCTVVQLSYVRSLTFGVSLLRSRNSVTSRSFDTPNRTNDENRDRKSRTLQKLLQKARRAQISPDGRSRRVCLVLLASLPSRMASRHCSAHYSNRQSSCWHRVPSCHAC